MGRFENFTPVIQLDEITSAEETMLSELVSLSNSSSGQFIRKEAGSLVNATLAETIALAGLSDVAISNPLNNEVVAYNGTSWVNRTASDVLGSTGTVTSVSVVTSNGVSGTVATSTLTPAITLTLGDITPSSIALGTGSITMTGSIAATGARVTKGWFTDIETTNALVGNVTGSAATVTGAAQAAITSLGTLTTLTVDDITINGNTISSAGASTLAINPTAGQAITFDGTVTLDAGVIAGATSITSTTFVGALTGTASGNLVSGGALGTPSSGTLTNCTGLPVAGLVALTASEIVITTAGGVLVSAAVATYPSLTELTYVKGVTSAIQTQLGTKVTSGGALGTPSSGTGTNVTGIPAANILAGSFGAGAYVISTSLQAATIELGHATDTTLSRVSAGVVAIEGVNILTTAGGTLTGNITLGEGADPATIGIVMDNSMSADERYSGITVPGTAGATIAFGDLCYIDVTATEWLLADASAASTAGDVVLGICIDASTDGAATSMLLVGTVRSAAFPASVALGAPVYVSEIAGDVTATAPVTTDSVMRRVGWAVTAEPNTIYFNPSNDYITHI